MQFIVETVKTTVPPTPGKPPGTEPLVDLLYNVATMFNCRQSAVANNRFSFYRRWKKSQPANAMITVRNRGRSGKIIQRDRATAFGAPGVINRGEAIVLFRKQRRVKGHGIQVATWQGSIHFERTVFPMFMPMIETKLLRRKRCGCVLWNKYDQISDAGG